MDYFSCYKLNNKIHHFHEKKYSGKRTDCLFNVIKVFEYSNTVHKLKCDKNKCFTHKEHYMCTRIDKTFLEGVFNMVISKR